MRPLRWQVAVVAAAGLALALETLPAVLRWLWVRRRRPRREVLFFPSQVTCTEALLRSPGATPSDCPCSLPHGESSLSRLLSALLAARVSLELCLFAFSSPQLGRAVQLLHQRGVRVRVVTDCDYMALNGSQIGLLRKAVLMQVPTVLIPEALQLSWDPVERILRFIHLPQHRSGLLCISAGTLGQLINLMKAAAICRSRLEL
ncbi:mitochondrial cardiolipin hydrolase isoform X3 [Bubalus kerabau]|uniref:mitochondrial cardiolipin hydrolase isoform X3 n=1 Tax=Bubalus carabanensis TaxID=3119969 RepID=UPI00244EE16D|nr:mitochondrial cardiolipin hydrolase isoform X3 [Bubalus carabanensis]